MKEIPTAWMKFYSMKETPNSGRKFMYKEENISIWIFLTV